MITQCKECGARLECVLCRLSRAFDNHGGSSAPHAGACIYETCLVCRCTRVAELIDKQTADPAPTIEDYVVRDERLRRVHLQFPVYKRSMVLKLLRSTHPGYITKIAGPVEDEEGRPDLTRQHMVVEIPE